MSHDECPPYPDYNGPTWVIEDGVASGFHPRPQGRWKVGEVLRARVSDRAAAVPGDAPGLRRDDRGTSLIVSVLAQADPEYCRDEDGDSPTPLIGQDGWWFQARVRPATPDEAADILAAEHTRRQRRNLESRRRNLFSFGIPANDAEIPPTAVGLLDGAHEVPFGEGRHWSTPGDQLLVDHDSNVVWSLTYNGADGDDWSPNNYHGYIAARQPLTEQRAALILELRAEYELDTWRREARIGPEAAKVLIDAGWTYRRAWGDLARFRLETTEDAQALLARPESQWQQSGWWGFSGQAGTRFTVTDARRLADAGITYDRAASFHYAGFRAVEEMLAANPPTIPEEPGRFLIKPRIRCAMGRAHVTTDAALVRRFLESRPLYWDGESVEHAPGIKPVHVARDWSLWSDGSLVRHAEWLTVYGGSSSISKASAPAPTDLHDAAAHAIDLVATACNDACRDRAIWHPLREAIDRVGTELSSENHSDGSWTESKTLTRHDYTLPDGNSSMWEVYTDAGGLVGGEGEYVARRRVFPDERAARQAYREHNLH